MKTKTERKELSGVEEFQLRQEVYGLTTYKLREEVILHRTIDYMYLLQLLAKGIVWVILNWKTVKAEIDRIRGKLEPVVK